MFTQIVLTFLVLFSLFLLFRNGQVYKERTKILEIIHDLSNDNIKQGKGWRWRYKLYESVLYEEMLFKFWKPINSFFPDEMFQK
jgi:hypothetical protein